MSIVYTLLICGYAARDMSETKSYANISGELTDRNIGNKSAIMHNNKLNFKRQISS